MLLGDPHQFGLKFLLYERYMIDLLIYFLNAFYTPLLNKRRQEREHNYSHAPLLGSTKLLA